MNGILNSSLIDVELLRGASKSDTEHLLSMHCHSSYIPGKEISSSVLVSFYCWHSFDSLGLCSWGNDNVLFNVCFPFSCNIFGVESGLYYLMLPLCYAMFCKDIVFACFIWFYLLLSMAAIYVSSFDSFSELTQTKYLYYQNVNPLDLETFVFNWMRDKIGLLPSICLYEEKVSEITDDCVVMGHIE